MADVIQQGWLLIHDGLYAIKQREKKIKLTSTGIIKGKIAVSFI